MLPRRYVVEVQNDNIVVRVTATSCVVSYHRVTYPPGIVPSKFPTQDDHRAPMSRLEFIKGSWQLAKAKLQEFK
jgi:hypothetical protein